MIKLKNRVIESQNKSPIVYDVFKPKEDGQKPVVIFCHGYKGFKDWGAWDLVAQSFAKAGFLFIKFNFSLNGGTVEQPIDFPDLEAFAKNNYSIELDDLNRVITHVTNVYKNEVALDNINIIGHSRGGGIVLIKGEEDSRVNKVITWAGVSDYKSRFMIGTPQFVAWKKTGRMFVKNGRTKQEMPHDWQFYKNFDSNEERLTIKRAVKSLNKPLLIIHGDNDTSVKIEEGKALKKWQPNAKFQIIQNSDHVFNTKHPWEENKLSLQLETVVNKTIDFIKI
ncbi:alpha/beta hydrolase [Patiriisocius marinistellae]|uniref:Alpha/beta hydrolase n=1 Tax=Patiriisocius marinistellae TaxID=2494560 RepID=A0A5J4FTM1_9FLAO|nr:alpha/beta fold hydrolase [Patiriisocius marinistellae]GEQ84953.1 alpha/beta hydrolase [Patiriisocius marinistellae]